MLDQRATHPFETIFWRFGYCTICTADQWRGCGKLPLAAPAARCGCTRRGWLRGVYASHGRAQVAQKLADGRPPYHSSPPFLQGQDLRGAPDVCVHHPPNVFHAPGSLGRGVYVHRGGHMRARASLGGAHAPHGHHGGRRRRCAGRFGVRVTGVEMCTRRVHLPTLQRYSAPRTCYMDPVRHRARAGPHGQGLGGAPTAAARRAARDLVASHLGQVARSTKCTADDCFRNALWGVALWSSMGLPYQVV